MLLSEFITSGAISHPKRLFAETLVGAIPTNFSGRCAVLTKTTARNATLFIGGTLIILLGTIVNGTYGGHKNIPYIFPYFY